MLIYKITNLVNGKIYIGQTIKTLEKRKKQHLSKYNNCPALKNALVKYGYNNFNWEILENAFSILELNTLEEFYINKFDCLAPKGYNLKQGGHNKALSQITKDKISNAQLGNRNHMFGKTGKKHPRWGKKHTMEARNKMSKSHKGSIGFLGEHTKESKLKMRNSKLGKKLSQEHVASLKKNNKSYLMGKKIFCNELQIEFISISKAAESLGIFSANIQKVLKGKRKSTGGYTFKYVEEQNG